MPTGKRKREEGENGGGFSAFGDTLLPDGKHVWGIESHRKSVEFGKINLFFCCVSSFTFSPPPPPALGRYQRGEGRGTKLTPRFFFPFPDHRKKSPHLIRPPSFSPHSFFPGGKAKPTTTARLGSTLLLLLFPFSFLFFLFSGGSFQFLGWIGREGERGGEEEMNRPFSLPPSPPPKKRKSFFF